MTRPINDIFYVDSKQIQVILAYKNGYCDGCYFSQNPCAKYNHIRGACSGALRNDNNDVIFKCISDFSIY